MVEESEKVQVASAEETVEELSGGALYGLTLGLLHGRMAGADKAEVMDQFRDGRLDVLVATTVVEVGVDVPNATAMVIHNPERFGLAQLHQLRGRIGRGTAQSFCWLLCDRFLGEDSYNRIRFFAGHSDGFALAEEDLRLRGPGDAWGVRQSGAPGFRLANPLTDVDLVQVCRGDARQFLAADPQLKSPVGRLVAKALREEMQGPIHALSLETLTPAEAAAAG